MNTMKKAYEKAKEYAKELISDGSDFRMEEVEHDEKNSLWKFTFSYLKEPDNDFERAVAKYKRNMKIITVDSDGKFISMKIRDENEVY